MSAGAPWPPAPPILVTPRGPEAQVWRLRLDREPAGAWRPLLTDAERARADRFQFDRDRHRFTVTRGVLRTLLGRYLDTAPDALRLALGPHGKPALDEGQGARDLAFNIAHSSAVALLAFATGSPIGVDVEDVTPARDIVALSRVVLAPPDHGRLLALPAAEQAAAFYDAWTCKEAVVKAVGGGLSIPLHGFDVAFPDAAPAVTAARTPEVAPAVRWSLRRLAAAPGYAAAVAVPRPELTLTLWDWG